MFELFMYVYSCNALSARFFAVDRALNYYFMIMIMITNDAGLPRVLESHEKSWNLISTFFRAWKVLESCLGPGKSWKVIENANFLFIIFQCCVTCATVHLKSKVAY